MSMKIKIISPKGTCRDAFVSITFFFKLIQFCYLVWGYTYYLREYLDI